MACGEYQTSTRVESAAGTPSLGWNWEKPVRVAAWVQTGSSSEPSMVTSASTRGGRTVVRRAIPEYVLELPGGTVAGAGSAVVTEAGRVFAGCAAAMAD